uniref:Uncharacterized protein n=1 Tax=Arundo donax TaxID=35708 RepID=A0A0A9EH16_ARUDO
MERILMRHRCIRRWMTARGLCLNLIQWHVTGSRRLRTSMQGPRRWRYQGRFRMSTWVP